jgi:hypothetical protein
VLDVVGRGWSWGNIEDHPPALYRQHQRHHQHRVIEWQGQSGDDDGSAGQDAEPAADAAPAAAAGLDDVPKAHTTPTRALAGRDLTTS